MNRRKFLAGSVALPIAAHAVRFEGQAAGHEGRHDAAKTTDASGQPNRDRYHHTLQRVLHGSGPAYTSEFLLEDLSGTPGRRFTNFSGDLSGRWIGALAASCSSFGEDFPVLDEFVKRALPLQHGEGYFGKSFNAKNPEDDDLALLWGNGRLLVGLVEYYQLRHDAAALAAARRLGDFLVAIGPAFNAQKMADDFGAGHFATSYICWTQQTEGLAGLYAATKETKYRDLCADIAARMERRAGDHVHGYLCSVRGTLALYEATQEKSYLKRAVAAWNDIEGSGDILITGAVPEAWSPKKKRTEGCAECDWVRLNLALYRATGEEKYLATAESMVFNEFAMNQFASGDFGHGVLDENGTPGTVAVRAWWCCTLHGLRTFADVNDNVFRAAGGDIFYDLAMDGHLKTDDVAVRAQSSLATDGRTRITIEQQRGSYALTVRKPAWADAVALTHNGRPVSGLKVAEVAAGDTVVAQYTMRFRGESAERVQARPGRKAFYFGPWLLGATSHEQPQYFSELQDQNAIIAESNRASHSRTGLEFAVPIAATSCAIIAAEYPEQAARVELRAVAEQTGYDPARWMTAFALREKG
ncbi:MAG TPA: beta-L-arabinofuranosidase domain-containing protein [Terracidiphilus sp.]|jgi:DUF1680 family protein